MKLEDFWLHSWIIVSGFFLVSFVDGTLLMPFFLSTIMIKPSSCRFYIEKAANKKFTKKNQTKENEWTTKKLSMVQWIRIHEISRKNKSLMKIR